MITALRPPGTSGCFAFVFLLPPLNFSPRWSVSGQIPAARALMLHFQTSYIVKSVAPSMIHSLRMTKFKSWLKNVSMQFKIDEMQPRVIFLSLSLFTAQSSMNKVRGDHFSGSAKMWVLNGWTRHHSGDQRSMRIQNSPTSSGFSPKNMFCHISGSQLCKCENNSCGRIIGNFTTDVSPFRQTGASNW